MRAACCRLHPWDTSLHEHSQCPPSLPGLSPLTINNAPTKNFLQLDWLRFPITSSWAPGAIRTVYYYSEFAGTGITGAKLSCEYGRWYNPGIVCVGFSVKSNPKMMVRGQARGAGEGTLVCALGLASASLRCRSPSPATSCGVSPQASASSPAPPASQMPRPHSLQVAVQLRNAGATTIPGTAGIVFFVGVQTGP